MNGVDSVNLAASPAELTVRPRGVTIGTFAGVHLGHRALIQAAIGRARELGVMSAAVTFEPVPAAVLRPEKFPGRICSAADKLELLADQRLDEIVTMRF